MFKKLLTLSFALLLLNFSAQNKASKGIPGDTFSFNMKSFKEKLATAGKNFDNGLLKNTLQIPLKNGQNITFNLKENELTTNRNLLLKTYDGQSEDGKNLVKVSVFNSKINAIIKTPQGYFMVEQFKTEGDQYRIYNMFDDMGGSANCGLDREINLKKEIEDLQTQAKILKLKAVPNFPFGDQLRKYRMAIATTGEFTQKYGTQDAALAEALNMLNLVNLIYESEASMTFNVVNETLNKTLIFTDPNTDPFTVSPSFASANNSQIGFTTLNTNGILPYANYDIGHTFNNVENANGIVQGQAGPNPCTSNSKARAWTQWSSNLAKGITANLIVHEMGHQFGAGHTFNAVGGFSGSPTFCTDGWNSGAAVEPGSGSTIMGYGNNCVTPVNQTLTGNNKLNYFNAKSLDQIVSVIAGSANCYVGTATGNTPPTANAGSDITIPKNTPFKLKGAATDQNGDLLNYTWEQTDVATANDKGALGYNITGTGGYAAVNSTTAPLFRSAQSTDTTERTFPNYKFIANNNNKPNDLEGEALPQVARSMKFRFTVRDNKLGGGGINSDEIIVNVSNDGPLTVTSQNTVGETVSANSTFAVTWEVNGTQNIKNTVDILLSADGGYSFPYLLKKDAPNNGSSNVTLANIPNTDRARIKVAASLADGAEFFDISNFNFTVTNAACFVKSTVISPTLSVSAVSGSAQANLAMVAPAVTNSGYFSNSVINILPTTVTPTQLVTYSDISFTTPKYVGNYFSALKRIRVTKTGTYTIYNSSNTFLMVTIYNASPLSSTTTSAQALASFVSSNAYESSPNYFNTFYSSNVTLTEGQDYYLNFCAFSNGDPASTHNLSFTGPGSFYEVATFNTSLTNYTYIAVDTAGMIKGQNATADFRTLLSGTYKVYGLAYSNVIDPATFINKNVSEILINCALSSDNYRDLNLTCTAATISQQPMSGTAALGGNYTFNVATTNSPVTYQWFKNSVAISGQNQSSLVLTNITAADFASYYVVLANGTCSFTSDTVTLSLALGTNSVDQSTTISLYPNPVKDYLNINSPKTVSGIEVYDASGKLVKRDSKNSKTIYLGNLKAGVYVVKVLSGTEVVKVQKIIKD